MKIVVQYFLISALIVGSAKAQCRLADNCNECLIAKPSYGDGCTVSLSIMLLANKKKPIPQHSPSPIYLFPSTFPPTQRSGSKIFRPASRVVLASPTWGVALPPAPILSQFAPPAKTNAKVPLVTPTNVVTGISASTTTCVS